MRINKKITTILASSLIIISMVGCAPKESATEVTKKYLDSVKSKDYETAYNLLSKDSKKDVTLEDYKEYQEVYDKCQIVKSYKLGEEKRVDKYKYAGKNYSKLIKIKETATLQSTDDNKEDTSNSDRYFIVEDNKYKLLWHDDFKENFSSNYVDVAWMEIDKKENKDLNRAAIDIKKAIEIDSKNSRAYYALAYVYVDLKRYDEALNAADKCLEYLDKDDEYYKSSSSDIYNLKGVIYMDKEDFSKAKEYYNKALELNSDNEYAKTNLNYIKDL
ncbi:tetratricopeptide repeat protein [Clostridioides sp. ES-S-0001-03]|uniref:tetratricopeptide repeat protein n=1 Tax=Clostridioides sp. ES-S-0001-03 TaxID=2770771 RepID=UPI001D0CB399|nr:tetratricopeptide repeat protein [Clostridioides sp. ES-S-0001-03]